MRDNRNIDKKTEIQLRSAAMLSENLSGMLDFKAIFGRNGSVELEIGSGKGTFLVETGQSLSSDKFFLVSNGQTNTIATP